jgi:hypothetical protein
MTNKVPIRRWSLRPETCSTASSSGMDYVCYSHLIRDKIRGSFSNLFEVQSYVIMKTRISAIVQCLAFQFLTEGHWGQIPLFYPFENPVESPGRPIGYSTGILTSSCRFVTISRLFGLKHCRKRARSIWESRDDLSGFDLTVRIKTRQTDEI